MAVSEAAKKWTIADPPLKEALNHFAIMFEQENATTEQQLTCPYAPDTKILTGPIIKLIPLTVP